MKGTGVIYCSDNLTLFFYTLFKDKWLRENFLSFRITIINFLVKTFIRIQHLREVCSCREQTTFFKMWSGHIKLDHQIYDHNNFK